MKRIDKAKEKIYKEWCPSIVDKNWMDYDDKTCVEDKTGIIVGCRGITCKKCWNKEVEGNV